MYETSKTNLDNVLQKININKIPFILLILILVIIIFVIIINDYFSFSKSKLEGFDLANDYTINSISKDNSEYEYKIMNSDDESLSNQKDNYEKYKDTYPDDYEKYKDQYETYKKESDKLNQANKDFKDYKNKLDNIKKDANDYKNTIKNEMLSIVNKETSKMKNNIPNFNIGIPAIKDPKLSNSLFIASFIAIILILCFVFLPSFKDFNKLFNQINNVGYVILYTIFIILFLRLMPKDVLNNHSYYIVPITLIFAFILFVRSFQSNYIQDFNVNYERIKIIIMYFCFITMCVTYYSVNPGEYITKNFNMSLLLSTLIGIFGFLYLIVLLTLPNNYDNFKNSKNLTNALANVSSFTKYGSICFVLFLGIMTTIIATYPGGFFKNFNNSIIIISLLLIVCVIWSVLLISNMFSRDNTTSENINKLMLESTLTKIKKALLALFGFTLSGIIIAYIVYNIQNLSGRSGIPSFILSIFLILSIFILIYKTIFVKLPSNNANKAKNSFFNLIINLIFYIPCLFSGVFDGIVKTLIGEYNSTTTGNILILIIILGLLLLYIYLPTIQHNINLQGGTQLVENPVYTNTMHSLANYIQLNGSEQFDYQYSISFWLFIDSNAPNTNPSYNQYTSVLNYGGKPNILYKAKTNTLMITMEQKDLERNSKNKLLEFDDNGNRIIYTNKNMLLQKWNNIIIQFNGGTLDIFLNGELVKSSIETIPYMSFDTLTIGSDGGINGGVCNLVYYKTPLTITNIHYIYKNVKDKSPPVIQKTNNTIISLTK